MTVIVGVVSAYYSLLNMHYFTYLVCTSVFFQTCPFVETFSWNCIMFSSFETPFPMLLCSSLTYNAKEIRMLLKEEEDEVNKWTVEWIIIDPASFTGDRPPVGASDSESSTIQPVVKNHRGSERYSSTVYSLSDDIFDEYYKQNPTSRLNVSSVCFCKTTDNFKLNASLCCSFTFWINIIDLVSNTFGPPDFP